MQSLSPADLAVLLRCALFHDMEGSAFLTLLNGTVSECPAGRFLIHEGQSIDRLWIVLQGVLHASRYEQCGREFLYQQYFPSHLAGGAVACTPSKTSPYGIYAASDCRLWSFPWAQLEQGNLPPALQLKLYQNLLSFTANQNVRQYYKIEVLSARGARERILKYLTAQSFRSGSSSFSISMDREAMANYLCLNRSVLSHELKQMEADGLLRFHKNHFTLLSPSAETAPSPSLSTGPHRP